MDELRTSLERVVSAGIRAYIALLCAGEKERSRRMLHDTMQLSSLGAGGPSQRVRVSLFAGGEVAKREEGGETRVNARSERGGSRPTSASSLARVLAFYTLRSLLASLLVLRASAYWWRVPELAELQTACAAFNRCLAEEAPEPAEEVAAGESG